MGAPRRAGHTKGHGCVPGGSNNALEFLRQQNEEDEYERKLRGEPSQKEIQALQKRKKPAFQNVYLELEHDGTKLGRLVFRLYDEYAPQVPAHLSGRPIDTVILIYSYLVLGGKDQCLS